MNDNNNLEGDVICDDDSAQVIVAICCSAKTIGVAYFCEEQDIIFADSFAVSNDDMVCHYLYSLYPFC